MALMLPIFEDQTDRLTWDTIDYSSSVPDSFLVPEHHWPEIQSPKLSLPLRIRLNHFASYFMCEMFIHFERSIIEYMEVHSSEVLQYINQKQFQRFVKEERDHIAAFESLARKIRPDLYLDKPRFMQPSFFDSVVIKRTPLPCFFMMAALFEEMTLFVYPVMLEKPADSWKPYLDVMRLHALEERSHIGVDRIIIEGRIATHGQFNTRLCMGWLVPLVAYSDRRIANSWKQAADYFSKQEGLSDAQRQSISRKGLSGSDREGMRAYVQKNLHRPIPGNGLLCSVLSRLAG